MFFTVCSIHKLGLSFRSRQTLGWCIITGDTKPSSIMNLRLRGWIATLATLLCFGQLLLAANLQYKQDGSGQLKIQLDYTMATRAKGVVDGADNLANIEDAQVDIQFGTHLEWKRNLDIKDGQLYKMAVDGYQDMTTNFGLYEFKQGQGNQKPPALPNVMTAFAFGKEIILVSSHKGKPFIDRTGPPSTILRSLQACQRTYAQDGQGPNKNHRHNARCGEIFALYHAELLHKAEDIKAMTPLKMVTIERDWKATDEQYAVKNPCSPDDNPSGPGGKMVCTGLIVLLKQLGGRH